MIAVKNLEKKFSESFRLNIPELTIKNGERVAVIGPNGSGKSTLLRLIAGIIKPDNGSICVDSGLKIGYEPQNAYCFRDSVTANVRLGAASDADIDAILKHTMLDALKDKHSTNLSGGEKQRMCLARMLAGYYDILLLDEPMSAADIETAKALEEYVLSVCEERKTTLLICTHLPGQALRVATKVLIMNHGSVSEYCDIAELKAPKSEFGKKFIEQWRIP